MKLRTFFFACFCGLAGLGWGQISFTPAVANFASVYQGAPATSTLTLYNNSSTTLVVQDIDCYHAETFAISDTAFVIAPGGNRAITVTCDPHQNVNYADWLLVKSSTHPEIAHARLYAIGKYTDPYWDATQNLYNESLKTALKTTITAGYVQLTYNDARDKMYMLIDNQAVNGQGATQNTLECIYTGYLAVGYTSRTDAQNTFNLNTEHTMPQSLFNSTLPQLSDLHHLFVTTAASNSERANKPFGTVTNPSWSQGGSNSNASMFEPRDQQKGASIRALLYFLFRYQDYQGFICGMETTLRNWHTLYPPDAVEKERDTDIFSFQHNHNPFVVHPEFMERIASLCSVNNGDPSPIADYVADTLEFGNVQMSSSRDGYYAIDNQGINAMTLSNLSISSPEFAFIGTPGTNVPADSLQEIAIRFTPTAVNQTYTATLTFSTNAPGTPTRTVVLRGNSNIVAVAPGQADQLQWSCYPQPARQRVIMQFANPLVEAATVTLLNLNGQALRTISLAPGQSKAEISLSGMSAGMYVAQLQTGTSVLSKKIVIE